MGSGLRENGVNSAYTQSDLDISHSSEHIISGEGLDAALEVLADAIESGVIDHD